MPNRVYNSGNYRYGFNGKEQDPEVSGDGNQYDYGFRIYDPRLVRFKSVDPLQKQYPNLTPYQFASNSPIANVDLDGREAKYYTTTIVNTETRIKQPDGTWTSSMSQTKQTEVHESGWKWSFPFYENNGPRGTGTLYTLKVQSRTITQDDTGLIPSTMTDEGPVLTAGSVYKFSEDDLKQINKKDDRPQYKGSVQVMIFGSGNGVYPDDNTGDKPNPNAKTITMDWSEWNEVFEPVLIGMDVKSPTQIELPTWGEILGEGFDQTVDKYKKIGEENAVVYPAGSDSCTVEGFIDSAGKSSHHPGYNLPTKVPHTVPNYRPNKTDTTSKTKTNTGSHN